MSEDKSRKTEKATPKKLRDARKKGQVAKSREVVSTFMLFISGIYFWLAWDWMLSRLVALIGMPADLYVYSFSEALKKALDAAFLDIALWLSLPFAFLLFVAGVVGSVAQFGWLISFDPIVPRGSKVNPAEGLKRIFSMRSLVETAIALLKVVAISLILYWVIKDSISVLIHDKSVCDVDCLRVIFQKLVFKLMLFVFPLLVILAIMDYIFQRFEFLKDQRMTREELKRDLKETEGDPLLAGYRKQISREYLEEEIGERIKRSRVLVVDLDISVALHYERGVTPLPVIMAIGRDQAAKQMVTISQEQQVPVIADPALARRLADEGTIDQHIPDSTVEATAKIMRRVAAT